jgi:hypothetical protein
MRVNWEACEAAMKRRKIARRHWIAKHTKGMCGVGKWLVTCNERENADCPRCSAPEDARHVWLCPDAEAKLIRNEGISDIAQWMEEVQTDPEIRTAIVTRLVQWADNLPMLPIQTDSVVLQDAIQHQDDIGWDNFFEGRIAKDWEQAQEAYYKWCRSRKSARRWTTALIQKLWNVAWDLWEQRNGIVLDAEHAEIQHNMVEVNNEIRAQFQQGHHGLQQRP